MKHGPIYHVTIIIQRIRYNYDPPNIILTTTTTASTVFLANKPKADTTPLIK